MELTLKEYLIKFFGAKESFFEEDVKSLTKFQNKNKTFGIFGFPPFFDCRSDEEKATDKGKTNYNSPARSRGRR